MQCTIINEFLGNTKWYMYLIMIFYNVQSSRSRYAVKKQGKLDEILDAAQRTWVSKGAVATLGLGLPVKFCRLIQTRKVETPDPPSVRRTEESAPRFPCCSSCSGSDILLPRCEIPLASNLRSTSCSGLADILGILQP